MATKNNPGKYDCYANAEPDEPMFILLGRDRHSPLLVRLWADLRAMDGEDDSKVLDAIQCSTAMRKFRHERQQRRKNALANEPSDNGFINDYD